MTKNGKPAVVFTAEEVRQGKVTLFSFTATAAELKLIGRVEHFGVDENGVNRSFDPEQALGIATSMIAGAVLLDSICGSLEGPWQVVDGKLVPGEGAYFTIDDGQHRFAALDLLSEEERANWSFGVMATMGFTVEERLRVFRQQGQRKRIDGKLDLAQRHVLDEWKTDVERAAYELVLRLHNDPDSPLYGRLILDEVIGRVPEGINGKGLWTVIRAAMGRHSPLSVCSLADRSTAVWNLIMAANDVWPKIWLSDEHLLTTSRGIGAIIKLVVSGTEFRGAIGDNFEFDSVRRALAYALRFDWKRATHRHDSTDRISIKLDESIGRARKRDKDGGGVKV